MTAPAVAQGWEKRDFKNALIRNDARAEIENKASIESLELLHYERRQAIEELAPLELLFGSGGERWDAQRKRHRAGISKLILVEMATEWQKKAKPGAIAVGEFKPPAENALERLANSDFRHIAFVDENEMKYAAYMHAQNRVKEINERIESRLAEMRFVTREIGLQ